MIGRLEVYVAGKFRGDVAANIMEALEHGRRILEAGAKPIVPHVSHAGVEDNEEAMRRCFKQILCCHAVYLIPDNWEESEGAHREREFALSIGLPVFHDIEAVRAWVGAA